MRTLDEVDLDAYDFFDFGANSGGSIAHCEKHVGGRGLGIDTDEKVVRRAQANGRNVVHGDITTLLDRKQVRYVSMFDFLEHLPDYDRVRAMIGKATAVAREFILLRHPSFEDEAYLRSIGFKQYWTDWPVAHPSHLLLSDLTEMLASAGAGTMSIEYVDPVWDSSDPSILPLDAPVHQHGYDEDRHGPKKMVKFDKPVWRQLRIQAYLDDSPTRVGRVAELEREVTELRNRRAVKVATAMWRVRQAGSTGERGSAMRVVLREIRGR